MDNTLPSFPAFRCLMRGMYVRTTTREYHPQLFLRKKRETQLFSRKAAKLANTSENIEEKTRKSREKLFSPTLFCIREAAITVRESVHTNAFHSRYKEASSTTDLSIRQTFISTSRLTYNFNYQKVNIIGFPYNGPLQLLDFLSDPCEGVISRVHYTELRIALYITMSCLAK